LTYKPQALGSPPSPKVHLKKPPTHSPDQDILEKTEWCFTLYTTGRFLKTSMHFGFRSQSFVFLTLTALSELKKRSNIQLLRQ
jgi:hypothetical protein